MRVRSAGLALIAADAAPAPAPPLPLSAVRVRSLALGKPLPCRRLGWAARPRPLA
jgi:hypothetical protein